VSQVRFRAAIGKPLSPAGFDQGMPRPLNHSENGEPTDLARGTDKKPRKGAGARTVCEGSEVEMLLGEDTDAMANQRPEFLLPRPHRAGTAAQNTEPAGQTVLATRRKSEEGSHETSSISNPLSLGVNWCNNRNRRKGLNGVS
jgi:hypothetical protein